MEIDAGGGGAVGSLSINSAGDFTIRERDLSGGVELISATITCWVPISFPTSVFRAFT